MEEFLHGIHHHRLPADEVRYCYEQQWAKHAALSHSNLDLKLLRCSLSHHHSCCCLLVYALNHPHFRLWHSHGSVAISLSTVSKAFSKSTNPRAMLSCTSSLFSTISIITYIPSAVRLLFLNICYSFPKSHSTLLRILASKTLSHSFSTWLSSVIPLYFHGSCTHPFLFHTKISTIRPIFHSFGIIPSCIPTFSSLPVLLTPTFPAISIISSRTSFAPVALRFSYCVLKFPLLHVLSPPFSLLS